MRVASLMVICVALSNALYAQNSQLAASTSVLAFHNESVFDGTRMLRGVNVVVESGMIRGVGPS